MAENKKSVVIYTDLIHTVEQLPDDKAGLLFKHVLRYVNDLNPVTDDIVINIAFEPIKQQLKRDLKKWEGIREKRSDAGKASAQSRKQKATKSTSVKSVKQKATKSTVSVNANVNVNDILKRENDFKDDIRKYKNIYDAETMKAFFNYWSEPNKAQTKMKYELKDTWHTGKRLSTWANNKDRYAK